MTPRAKLFLGLAVGGGVLAVMASSKKSSAAEAEPDDDVGPELPGGDLVQLPPLFNTPPAAGTQPAPPPVPLPIPPLPGDVIPPPVDFEDDDEREDLELTPIAPPFVPPPISNAPAPGPAPAPAPPVQPPVPLPPAIIPPEIVEQIPDIIPLPVINPPRPRPAPAPAPRPEPPPSPEPEEQPTVLPEDTAELLRIMLARESTADWKRKEPLLEQWQRARGLVVDGQFGPGNAAVMATETGLIPIVRFWPRGTFPEGPFVEDFRNVLRTEANSAEEPRRSQLLAAAEREHGQGFERNPRPITPTISI
jgi:hypothetical protein